MTDIGQDLRYALRGLRQRPGFTLGVVLTLALGIGANATMFGVVDRLLFRPPPDMTDVDRVHRVYLARKLDGEDLFQSNFQYRRFQDLTRWTRSFDATAAMSTSDLAIGVGESALEMRVGAVSAGFFRFFDVAPVAGRLFSAAEDSAPEGTPVAVLSYELWRDRFGGRSDVMSRQLQIGAQTYTIVGVMPPGFAGMWPERPPVAWIPITAFAAAEFRSFGRTPSDWATTYSITWLQMMARRKPGVTQEVADADLSQAYQRSYAVDKDLRPNITNPEIAQPRAVAGNVLEERGPRSSPDSKVASWVSGVALIVLLIACANVANLLLARALQRRREVAVRLALGVTRRRLASQLLTESLVLAGLGGLAGLAVAQWGGALLRSQFLRGDAPVTVFGDLRTLGFAAAAVLFVGIVTGLAPVLQTGRHADLASALKAGAREGTYHRSRLRVGLLVLQATLSVVLLIGAGLFVKSLRHVRGLALGYDVDQVMWVWVEERSERLTPAEKRALRDRLHRTALALPGVESASRAVTVPFMMFWDESIYVSGIDSTSRLGSFTLQATTPDYFRTMGTRILRGRGLESTDLDSAPRVMVISEAMGRALWPGKDPLGQCVRVGADTVPCTTVVGVAGNIRHDDRFAEDKQLHYYLPIAQKAAGSGGLYVRVTGDAADQAESVRRALQREMPGSSYVTVRPMADIYGPTIRSWRLGATMFTAFGGLALALAAIGLYSVISYGVAQRTHELGVRVALGANTPRLLWLVVGEGLRLGVAAVALGLGIAALLVRWIAPLLYETPVRDPWIFGAVGVTLIVVAAVASFIPALRATRVDPNVALRSD